MSMIYRHFHHITVILDFFIIYINRTKSNNSSQKHSNQPPHQSRKHNNKITSYIMPRDKTNYHNAKRLNWMITGMVIALLNQFFKIHGFDN